jgi:hypothetical protein
MCHDEEWEEDVSDDTNNYADILAYVQELEAAVVKKKEEVRPKTDRARRGGDPQTFS